MSEFRKCMKMAETNAAQAFTPETFGKGSEPHETT
jgi:hypothetical protein